MTDAAEMPRSRSETSESLHSDFLPVLISLSLMVVGGSCFFDCVGIVWEVTSLVSVVAALCYVDGRCWALKKISPPVQCILLT